MTPRGRPPAHPAPKPGRAPGARTGRDWKTGTSSVTTCRPLPAVHAPSTGYQKTLTGTRVLGEARSEGAAPHQVRYASYGSNTHLDRLAFYIAGGRPPGAARTYPGCRDRRAPAASVPVELEGALHFATESPVWAGARAFYDPGASGRVLARAHLVTAEQFSDIAAQEMYRNQASTSA